MAGQPRLPGSTSAPSVHAIWGGIRMEIIQGAYGEHWWSRALAAGCSVQMAYERQLWGDNWELLKDPFGIEWAIDEPAS